MSPFLKDFKELILLTNGLCDGQKSTSTALLIKRLKDFDESYLNNCGSDDLLHLKLRLLSNLMFVTTTLQNNDQKCIVINCMKTILSTSVIADIQLFIHLYNAVFFHIYKEQNVTVSEEIKLAVLEFNIELIKRSTSRLFQLLYNEEYSAKFSMGILISVQIAKEEKSIKLRTTALDFLLFAMQYHRKNDKILQDAVGNLFMFYLPGIIGRVQDIILRDETQPHLITLKAVTCWGQLLYTVMQDLAEEGDKLSDEEKIRLWMDLSKQAEVEGPKNVDTKKALQEKTRSKNWLEAAAQSILPLILRIAEARKHSHVKVRTELTVQISRLLDNCLVTLKTAIIPFIEILISASEDEEEEVRDAAEFALSRFENRCRSENGYLFINCIEDNLNTLINKLPNVIHLRDDKAILNALQSFCGVLKILHHSHKLSQIINFSPNLFRIIRILIICSRLDFYPEISTKDFSVSETDVVPSLWSKEWKRFKHFTDEHIVKKLREICRLLGSSGDIETILDCLFDRLREEKSCRNEILFLINEIVSGCPDIQDNVVKQFLDFYLDPDNQHLTLEVDDFQCLNLQQSYANIITVALLTEGIGKLSKVIGRRFENYLLISLYCVIEKMGSSYRIIRSSAVTTATQISDSLGLGGDIRSLIQNNTDYLTYHVTVKLRNGHPGVFDVVTVLMQNSPFEAVTNLEEVVNNVLKSSSDKYESPYVISHLRLFQTFVLCVNKWISEGKVTADIPKPEEKSEVDDLVEFIDEMEKPKEEQEETETKEEKPETPIEDDADCYTEEKKPKPPKHIQLVVSISENALNYLPSSDFEKKLIVLEILNESVLILADWEDELLPLVHKIWSPLVARFERISDPLLINRSFALLYSLSRTSKDFIRRRTLKNVLPTLRGFLSKSANNSKLKDSGTGYQYTQNFKLQRELLGKLAVLAIDLQLTGKELDSIVECALPYLSSLQPLALQENCRQLFLHLKDHDPYLVWYKIQGLQKNSEFVKNVGIVMENVFSRSVEPKLR